MYIDLVQQYKYLGLLLDEHLKFEPCDDMLAKLGGRALASLINKYNVSKNFNHDIFIHLFNTCISSILLYGSEACGYNTFNKCNQIQYRAMRFFWGVHKYAPIIGRQGDMGWVSLTVDRHVSMVRFWNRLINMKPDRLTKRIFLWDYQLNNNNWSSHV